MSADVIPFVARLAQPPRDGFAARRREACKSFVAAGLPGRRDEAWKYTDLTALGAHAWPRAAAKPIDAGPLPAALGRRVVWADGVLASNDAGDLVNSLADLAQSPPTVLADTLGSVAGDHDPVAALNTALFDHGAWIDVPANPPLDAPVELVFAAGEHPKPASLHARIAVRVAAGGRLVLIERHVGGGETLSSRVGEFVLGADAELVHVRINEAGARTRLLGRTAVCVGTGAAYRYLGLDFGARLCRETLTVTLAGSDADASIVGLALLDARQHADSNVTVEHATPRTRSRQFFRGVLDGRSRNVYSSCVHVAHGAQKTDSIQQSSNLLLSRNAEADTRPQLEIYADDVACTHGSATGAIDPEALFYLQSRGIGPEAARRIVAYGFAARALAEFGSDTLHPALAGLIAARLDAPAEVREWL